MFWRSALALCACVGLVLRSAQAGDFVRTTQAECQAAQRQCQAGQFLARGTFGPTMAQIDALAEEIRVKGRDQAFSDWIDAEFAKPTTSQEPVAIQMILARGYPAGTGQGDADIALDSDNLWSESAWWHAALTANDQLRQRMAWALAQIFVINNGVAAFTNSGKDTEDGVERYRSLSCSDYYDDVFVTHAFGNYRAMLEEVTYSPVMGIFLSHLGNRKQTTANGVTTYPDENYSREIEQLFSVGLNLLNIDGSYADGDTGTVGVQPVPTYTNDDITNLARVFTGLGYINSFTTGIGSGNQHVRMKMYATYHDFNAKTFLGGTVSAKSATDANGNLDVTQALDIIHNHANVGPFFSKLLIQRFVKSNPSKAYIQRVAQKWNNNGSGVRGDLKAVLKAILIDSEANGAVVYSITQRADGKWVLRSRIPDGTNNSRLREPLLQYIAMIRALAPTGEFPSGILCHKSVYADINQSPFRSPTVFNFFLPDYQPQGSITDYAPPATIPNGKLSAPEFQILTAVSANKGANMIRGDINRGGTAGVSLPMYSAAGTPTNNTFKIIYNFGEYATIAGTGDFTGLVERLDIAFAGGTLPENVKLALVNAIAAEKQRRRNVSNTDLAKAAVLSVITSAASNVDE